MSYYVWGSGLSYHDYLQSKSFLRDITSATRTAGRVVSMEIAQQTRNLIASTEALAQHNIKVNERLNRELQNTIEASTDIITDSLMQGFDQLSYELRGISSAISELGSQFHWGFSQMIVGIGHMNDALSELIKIAKTPVQTVAFNHFEIARDAFRQGLYREALEELQKAILGDHASPGYKLEWRFYQMLGTINLGFADCDHSLIDLVSSEEAFLKAARYALVDYPTDAGLSFLSAGWAAYCQGRMKDALSHTEQALALLPNLGEAYFQASKVCMALGQPETAFPRLRKAIDIDSFYIIKAASDGDFKRHDVKFNNFIRALNDEKYQTLLNKIEPSLMESEAWLSRKIPQDIALDCVALLNDFIGKKSIPLLDLIEISSTLLNAVESLNELNLLWKEQHNRLDNLHVHAKSKMDQISFWREHALLARDNTDIKLIDNLSSISEQCPLMDIEALIIEIETALKSIQETIQESLIIISSEPLKLSFQTISEPSGLFHKEVIATKTTDAIRDDIYSGTGELITSIIFLKIPAGSFMMGETGTQHEVIFSHDFYMAKYLITQRQWQAIMGTNPSRFKNNLDLPVERVSWDDCQAFIKKLNGSVGKRRYRLPTEEEWEYACRANSTTQYHFGNSTKHLSSYAWYDANSQNQTHPVGELYPNNWGLYDMHGNVSEWTENFYEVGGNMHALRGGAWYMPDHLLRCAVRGYISPNLIWKNVNGFRFLRTLD